MTEEEAEKIWQTIATTLVPMLQAIQNKIIKGEEDPYQAAVNIHEAVEQLMAQPNITPTNKKALFAVFELLKEMQCAGAELLPSEDVTRLQR